MAIQVDRHQSRDAPTTLVLHQESILRPAPALEVLSDQDWVHGVAVGLDVDEHRAGAGLRDRLHGRDEALRDGEDQITRADADCLQGYAEGVGPAPHANGMRHFAVLGKGVLELRYRG